MCLLPKVVSKRRHEFLREYSWTCECVHDDVIEAREGILWQGLSQVVERMAVHGIHYGVIGLGE